MPRAWNDPNRQLRHFVITMSGQPWDGEPWPDPLDADRNTDDLDEAIQRALMGLDTAFGSRNVRYRVAALEKGAKAEKPLPASEVVKPAKNGLHLQCYVETFTSVRLRTVWRALPFARVRPRKMGRDTAREYCLPAKGLVGVDFDPTHIAGPWEVGEWRASAADEVTDSPLDAATRMVVEGFSLREVARAFPRVFVRHGAGLERLRDTLHGAPGDEFSLGTR